MQKKTFVMACVAGFFSILIWNSSVHAAPSIRLNLGGAKFPTVSGDLSVSITVDTITPTVAVGTAADQSFRDDTVGAAFFGYYLSAGVRSQQQANGTSLYLQVYRGAQETAGRTYYLLGNGTSTPTAQSNLTIAPATATTIATTARNSTECGPNYAANGIDLINGVNCTNNNLDPNFDITVFVKVLWSDPPSAAIVSNLTVVEVVQ